jgi:biotin operon repressor
MKSLPIRQRLSALTCLKAGAKLVLTEVCELHENGTHTGGATASNPYLAQRLGLSERTVSRLLQELGQQGLLEVREAQGKGRRLLPTPAVRAAYLSDEPSQVG